MLLGEIDLKGNDIKNGIADDHTHSGSQSDANGTGDLIAMAGDLFPVDRAGSKLNEVEDVSQGSLNLYPLSFNALILSLLALDTVRYPIPCPLRRILSCGSRMSFVSLFYFTLTINRHTPWCLAEY